MNTMELEEMTLEELASIKGGEWFKTEAGWEWRDEKSLIPKKEGTGKE